MGIFRGAMKGGLTAKAAQVAKREASKPENQAKAKSALSRFTSGRKAKKKG
ncbi:MAG: hypothetical protein K0Q93_1427 [Nocardioidaceae bacterium]|jgi:hypothetical protein|nr:hypothetical protein [Nocardioidaceae bacterium]